MSSAPPVATFHGLTLSLLADQFSGHSGGARFTRQFSRALLAAADDRVAAIHVIATQGEDLSGLASADPRVRIVHRRVPARVRGTAAARFAPLVFPRADVSHGLFQFVFPRQGRATAVTIHDISMAYEEFHPPTERGRELPALEAALRDATAIICSSDATREEIARRYPTLHDKCVRIYCGAGMDGDIPVRRAAPPADALRRTLLAVGTVEPRKNYDRVLDALELLHRDGTVPGVHLVLLGARGWRCDATIARLERMVAAGLVTWLPRASDAELREWYARAGAFTYLSTYEGFGFPPFEAARAGVPMVLGNASSVGEIWHGHAACVNPTDVRDIARGWHDTLTLADDARAALVARQQRRAAEFTWLRCAEEHLALYSSLHAARVGTGRPETRGTR